MRKMKRRGNKNKILETKEQRMWAGGRRERGRKYQRTRLSKRVNEWVQAEARERVIRIITNSA